MRPSKHVYYLVLMAILSGLAGSLPEAWAEEPTDTLAKHLLGKAGGSGKGVCVLPRADEGKLALAITQNSEYLVQALASDAKNVAPIQKLAGDAGLRGRRLYVEPGSFSNLPLSDNYADLLLVTDLTDADLSQLSLKEMLRVLSPSIGQAILGRAKTAANAGTLSMAGLEKWVKETGVAGAKIEEDARGLWVVFKKPPLVGADDWTHWFHGPDNNPVSSDSAFKAPFMVGWMGKPYHFPRFVGGRVAAGGRVFVTCGAPTVPWAEENSICYELTARNAWNGQILWSRKLPVGTRVMGSNVIATPDVVYLLEGDKLLALEAGTGKEIGQIKFEGVPGQGKWMGLSEGLLVLLAGEPDPPEKGGHFGLETRASLKEQKKVGYGTVLAAYDLKAQKIVWRHEETKPIDARQVAVGEGKVYFYAPESRLGALDLKTGKVLWTNDKSELITAIDEMKKDKWEGVFVVGIEDRPGLMAVGQALYLGTAEKNQFVAVSSKDGSLLWKTNRRGGRAMNFLLKDDKLFITETANSGNSGILDPLTGKNLNVRMDLGGGCGVKTASATVFCGQVGGAVYDLASGRNLPAQHIKTECQIGTYISQGSLYSIPAACRCTVVRGYISEVPLEGVILGEDAKEADRLEKGVGDYTKVAPLKADAADWATHRGNNRHSGSSLASVADKPQKLWENKPATPYAALGKGAYTDETDQHLLEPVAVGGLVFTAGTDGKVQALDAKTGQVRWSYAAGGPILATPTVWDGRVYAGSADGCVYALEATSGRLLWRFRAAPTERKIMVYGYLQSGWPVNSGVLVEDGTAYFAAGMPLQPGAYVFALDAVTGRIKWQVSDPGPVETKDGKYKDSLMPSGYLAIVHGKLWLRTFRGGSTGAVFDLKTGQREVPVITGGLRGRELGVLNDRFVIYGGGDVYWDQSERQGGRAWHFGFLELDSDGKAILPDTCDFDSSTLPAAWDDKRILLAGVPVGFSGQENLECWDIGKTMDYFHAQAQKTDVKKLPSWRAGQLPEPRPSEDRKTTTMRNWGPLGLDLNGIALAKNAGVVLARTKSKPDPKKPQGAPWKILFINLEDGKTMAEETLPSEPARDGLCIDRSGQVMVTLRDGGVVCYGK